MINHESLGVVSKNVCRLQYELVNFLGLPVGIVHISETLPFVVVLANQWTLEIARRVFKLKFQIVTCMNWVLRLLKRAIHILPVLGVTFEIRHISWFISDGDSLHSNAHRAIHLTDVLMDARGRIFDV